MTMTGSHDGVLVAVSILIAMAASYTALDLANRIRASQGWLRNVWLGAAAIAMGGGIWSMHFVAMLAFEMPGMGFAYSPGLTILSLVLAVLVTGAGFAVMSGWRGSLRRLGAAGLLMGLGVVAMHYVGMAAMQMPAELRYDPKWVVVSVVIAIGAATAALWIASQDRRPLENAAATVVMGGAIAGMHYAGMQGVSFRMEAHAPVHAGADMAAATLDQSVLAVAVAAATLLILFLALASSIFDRRFADMAQREARMRLRLQLSDVMREAATEDALRDASALMGLHFHVSRVGYGQLDPDEDVFDYQICWTDLSVGPLLGRFPAAAFGPKIVAELSAGRTVAIDDLSASPLSDEVVTRATASDVDTRAILVVPFVRDGRLRTIVYLNDRHPRAWAADDIGFMEEVAERTRQVVARGEIEAELRSLNATLEARVEERTTALQATEAALRQSQKMEAIGQLTGGIAHDFNNMLTGVIGNLELLKRGLASGRADSIERFADAAAASAQRAAALTARLLAYARRQPLDSRPVNVAELIRALEDLLRTSLGEAVSYALDADSAGAFAQVDPHQLENAILNLAINARDAMVQGGTLRVGVGSVVLDESEAASLDLVPGRYVTVTVADNGTGMSPEMAERAFEPFFTTKPVGQGTGLGLSMVYGFARQSGGQARIESAEGSGTAVTLFLPAAAAVDSVSVADRAAIARGDGQPILLVEDDDAVRVLVSDLLGELGYRVTAIADPLAALPVLSGAEPFALMITDIGMPGMNGRDLADAARRHRPELPILMLTGYAERAADQASFLAPGMALMLKPFALDTLAAKVGSMVRD